MLITNLVISRKLARHGAETLTSPAPSIRIRTLRDDLYRRNLYGTSLLTIKKFIQLVYFLQKDDTIIPDIIINYRFMGFMEKITGMFDAKKGMRDEFGEMPGNAAPLPAQTPEQAAEEARRDTADTRQANAIIDAAERGDTERADRLRDELRSVDSKPIIRGAYDEGADEVIAADETGNADITKAA